MQLDLPLAAAGAVQAPPTPQPAPSTLRQSLRAAPLAPSNEVPGTLTRQLQPPPSEAPGTLDRPPAVEFVRHPRARRYVIRVRGDGTVRVTIPRGGSKREGEEFAERQGPWVEKQRERIARERAQLPAATPAIDREALARAKAELPVRLLALAGVHGLEVARVSIRNQKWRWGSCSRSGHICLNWRLVRMPAFVSDYVMIHELMHLKRLDHSPRFWKLVAAACPDYQSARAWLRQHARS